MLRRRDKTARYTLRDRFAHRNTPLSRDNADDKENVLVVDYIRIFTSVEKKPQSPEVRTDLQAPRQTKPTEDSTGDRCHKKTGNNKKKLEQCLTSNNVGQLYDTAFRL